MKKHLMRLNKILMCFRKDTTDNLMFDVELANKDLEIDNKLLEFQKDVQGNLLANRPRVGPRKTPVTSRQMLQVGVRRHRIWAR